MDATSITELASLGSPLITSVIRIRYMRKPTSSSETDSQRAITAAVDASKSSLIVGASAEQKGHAGALVAKQATNVVTSNNAACASKRWDERRPVGPAEYGRAITRLKAVFEYKTGPVDVVVKMLGQIRRRSAGRNHADPRK